MEIVSLVALGLSVAPHVSVSAGESSQALGRSSEKMADKLDSGYFKSTSESTASASEITGECLTDIGQAGIKCQAECLKVLFRNKY